MMMNSQQTVLTSDPRDMTAQYNTRLSAKDEERFQQWSRDNGRDGDLYDYDLRGAWAADAKAVANGHLPDTWKKPNHPTFSNESKYSSEEAPGGKWSKDGSGRWLFEPSKLNLQNFGVEGLRRYFQEREPDADLIIPDEAKMFPKEYQPGE